MITKFIPGVPGFLSACYTDQKKRRKDLAPGFPGNILQVPAQVTCLPYQQSLWQGMDQAQILSLGHVFNPHTNLSYNPDMESFPITLILIERRAMEPTTIFFINGA